MKLEKGWEGSWGELRRSGSSFIDRISDPLQTEEGGKEDQ